MRDGKQILVANRLRKRLVTLGLASYEEYYALVTSAERAPAEMPHFIDAVSTNETYFFREDSHLRRWSARYCPSFPVRETGPGSGARDAPPVKRRIRCESWRTGLQKRAARATRRLSAPTSARP